MGEKMQKQNKKKELAFLNKAVQHVQVMSAEMVD